MSERDYARNGVVYYGMERMRQRAEQVGLLDAGQELELARRIEAGDLEAKAHMIEANLRLVMSIANQSRFQAPSIEYEDKVQEGMFGLIRAAERFDYRRGFRFGTFAYFNIGKAIQTAIWRDNKGKGLTQQEHRLASQIGEATSLLEQELGRSPKDNELADFLECDESVLAEARRLAAATLSVDVPVSEDGRVSLSDQLADSPDKEPSNQVSTKERDKKLVAVLGQVCTPVEAKVISLRFGLGDGQPKTQKEVAQELQTTISKVRSHEAKGLGILRTRRDLKEVA